MNEHRPVRIAGLLDLAGGETEGSWRQVALLAGMSARAEAKSKSPTTARTATAPATTIPTTAPTTAPAVVMKLIYLDAEPPPGGTPEEQRCDRRTLADARAIVRRPGKPGVPPPPKIIPLTPAQQAVFDHGKSVFTQTCAACHQATGLGLEGLAPPLVDSEWVLGSPQRLARIIIHGVAVRFRLRAAFNLKCPPCRSCPMPISRR